MMNLRDTKAFSVNARAKDGTVLAAMTVKAFDVDSAKWKAARELHHLADDDRFDRFEVLS